MTVKQPQKNDLEPIETASVDELQALQLSRLKWSLNHAYNHSALYAQKFDAAGIHPNDLTQLEDLSQFPFTSKGDLRKFYPFEAFATPMKDVVRVHASSGTTGKPTVVGYTQNDIDVWSTVMARSIRAAGGRADDLIHISYGYGLFTGGLAFFGSDFLERIFGHYALVTSLPETQPLSYRRVMGIYFCKELLFYALFTFAPLTLGALLGTSWSFIVPGRMLRLMASLLPSFCAGLAGAFLVASLYRRSLYAAVAGGGTLLLVLGALLAGDGLPQLAWYLDGSPPLPLGWGLALLPALAAALLVGEFHEQALPPVQGYREQYRETLARSEWSRRWPSRPSWRRSGSTCNGRGLASRWSSRSRCR
jgi:hypothetical protein